MEDSNAKVFYTNGGFVFSDDAFDSELETMEEKTTEKIVLVDSGKLVIFYLESSLLTMRRRDVFRDLPRIGEFVTLDDGVFEVTGIQHDFRDMYLGNISIFLRNSKNLVMSASQYLPPIA